MSLLTARATREYFSRHLFLSVGARKHVTLLFTDVELPHAFLDGLAQVPGTKLEVFDSRQVPNQADVVQEYYDPSSRYVSVHDYSAHRFYPASQAAGRVAGTGQGIDVTTFEFPRFDLSPAQIELLLARMVSGSPQTERLRADGFFRRLADRPDYRIQVRSGDRLDREMTVSGPRGWVELCGPLMEGDIRFAPGSELFYNGTDINGTLHCAGGLNLLPFRSESLDEVLCRRILGLGARIGQDPLDLDIEAGRLVGIRSGGPLAAMFQETFKVHEAFTWVVEIGIGMSDGAAPLIHDWSAPTNESVPGVHLGLGADPGDPGRFDTAVHMDFVCPQVLVRVNEDLFFDRGSFLA